MLFTTVAVCFRGAFLLSIRPPDEPTFQIRSMDNNFKMCIFEKIITFA